MNALTSQHKRHLVTIFCVSSLVLSVIAYMYFLSLSVVHVVMRKESLQEIQQLRSEIAFLESAYIEANHRISQRVAEIPGFSSIEEKVFINRDAGAGLVLRTANE